MKKLTILTIIMILILFIIGFLIYSSFLPSKTGKIITTEDDSETIINQNPEEQEEETETTKETGGTGAGQGTTTSGNGKSSNSNAENLPPDFYNAPCGTYYSSHGVCGGTCPLGTCKEIGKSCYCILEK